MKNDLKIHIYYPEAVEEIERFNHRFGKGVTELYCKYIERKVDDEEIKRGLYQYLLDLRRQGVLM